MCGPPGLSLKRRLHLNRADALQRHAAERLKRAEGIKRVAIAGDLRRGCELVGELALVAQADAGFEHSLKGKAIGWTHGDFGRHGS
jgi:DNA polymerase (family X)